MSELPRISESEWDVMNVLWEDHPQTAQEVSTRLSDRRQWSDRTVKTLLARLVKKGVLAYEVDGKRYLYRPAVDRESCVAAESRSFLERVHRGAASPLLMHFLRQNKLTPEELSEIRRVLEEHEEEA